MSKSIAVSQQSQQLHNDVQEAVKSIMGAATRTEVLPITAGS